MKKDLALIIDIHTIINFGKLNRRSRSGREGSSVWVNQMVGLG